MGIFSRISDIFNSNLVAILDKAEDPEKMIRLIINEMEETLVEVKSSAAKLIAEQKNYDRRIDKINTEITLWEERAELALEKDREDLAKSALKEKLDRQDQLAGLEEEREGLRLSIEKCKSDMLRLEDKLAEAVKKQKVLTNRKTAANAQLQMREKLDKANRVGAYAKFDRLERNIDRLEGVVESKGLGKVDPLETEFANLETDTKLEAELAKLKESKGLKKSSKEQK